MNAQLTFVGSPAVERELEFMLQAITNEARAAIPPSALEALVLIGSYGRSEGGIERTNARERPHNNLDLLLITRRGRNDRLRSRLSQRLESLRRAHGVGIDVGAVSRAELIASKPKVMWHDMVHGHRTLLGDASFVPSLHHLLASPTAADVRQLVMNRGALLLINRAAGASAPNDEDPRRRLLRHAVKALIGYGDAWLFSRGAYDSSYAKKRGCMRERDDAPGWLRELYEAAVAFRFEADYRAAQRSKLGERIAEAAGLLANLHLTIERHCLGAPSLTWDEHLSASLRTALLAPPRSLRDLGVLARNVVTSRGLSSYADVRTRIAARLASGQDVLAATFPIVAHHVAPNRRAQAARLLGAHGSANAELLAAFLRRWGAHGDVNYRPLDGQPHEGPDGAFLQ
jgi:hypothetical protein